MIDANTKRANRRFGRDDHLFVIEQVLHKLPLLLPHLVRFVVLRSWLVTERQRPPLRRLPLLCRSKDERA